jgi:hypothetical protein
MNIYIYTNEMSQLGLKFKQMETLLSLTGVTHLYNGF